MKIDSSVGLGAVKQQVKMLVTEPASSPTGNAEYDTMLQEDLFFITSQSVLCHHVLSVQTKLIVRAPTATTSARENTSEYEQWITPKQRWRRQARVYVVLPRVIHRRAMYFLRHIID